MIKYQYPAEKFTSAVRSLSVVDASLAERLTYAARDVSLVRADDLPEGDEKQNLIILQRKLTATSGGAEGSIVATINGMNEEQLIQTATEIFDLFLTFRDLNEQSFKD